MKLIKVIKEREILKIFLKFPISSFLSFLIRFLSLYFLVDLLEYNYNAVYIITYIYVVIQSYLIQKYFVQKSSQDAFIKFFISNIFLGILEYGMISALQLFFNSYYSLMLVVSAIIIYFIRFYIYTFKIFKNN